MRCIVRKLANAVRFCFCLQMISLIVDIPTLIAGIFHYSNGMGVSDDYFRASMRGALGVLAFFTIAQDALPAIAWWSLRKGRPAARKWAIAASLINFTLAVPGIGALHLSGMMFSRAFHFPVGILGILIGAAGLIVFSSPQTTAAVPPASRPKPQRQPGDGTSRWAELIAPSLALSWIWPAYGWWGQWSHAHHLLRPSFLIGLLELQAAILLVTAGHELGHAIAGWAAGMKLRAFAVGPFQWAVRNGKGRFEFKPAHMLGGGAAGMAPAHLAGIRRRTAFMIMGGPAASLLLGVACAFAAISAAGQTWELLWAPLAMMATLSTGAFLVNLVPHRPESLYSDGAQIYQLLKRGPWADTNLAFSMVASTLVTPARPSEWDVAILRKAGDFVKQGERGLRLRLYASMHYLEVGNIPEALASIKEAEDLYDQVTLRKPGDACAEFVFINAIFKQDLEAAEFWWRRLEDQPSKDLEADYWMARASIMWLRGETEEARRAWTRGNAFAMALPNAGAYDHIRWRSRRIKEKLPLNAN
jgi:hypothetical protein